MILSLNNHKIYHLHFRILLKFVKSFSSTNTIIKKDVIKIDPSQLYKRNVNICKRFSRNVFFFRPWFLRYIPKDGYPIDINYIDTQPDADSSTIKTILLLHGTPGSYYDYFRMIAEFGSQYRIIAPNFPDFNHTIQTGCFWHSSEEKSEFIVDFLKDLNVKNIHCLVAHSLAAYTASYLWIYANHDDYFNLKSICLLSPVGRYEYRWKERLKMNCITHLSRTLAMGKYLPIMRWINYKNPRKSPLQNIFSNYEIAMWKAITEGMSNYQNYHLRLKVLSKLKIPTLFMFSSVNDKQYVPAIYYNQLMELDIDSDDFDIYEQYENNLVQSSSSYENGKSSWIKVVDLRSAGHYMHNTHTLLIHSYINDLLENCDH